MNVDRGLHCEEAVEKYFRKFGYSLLARRLKTPYAEIDLLVSGRNFIYLVEVKSSKYEAFRRYRVGRGQTQRLLRTLVWLREQYRRPTRLLYVFVDANDQLELVFPFES